MKKSYDKFVFLDKGFKNRYEDFYSFKFKSVEINLKNYFLSSLNQGKEPDSTQIKTGVVKRFFIFIISNMDYLSFFRFKHPFRPYNPCENLLDYLFLKFYKCGKIGVLNIYEKRLLLVQGSDLEILDLELNQLNKVWEEIKESGFEKVLSKKKDIFLIRKEDSVNRLKAITLHKKELLGFNRNYFVSKGFYSFKPNEGVRFNIFFLFGVLNKGFSMLELFFFNSKDWVITPGVILGVGFEFFYIVSMRRCSYFSMGKNHLLHYSRYKKRVVDNFKIYEIKGPKKKIIDRELENDFHNMDE